MKQVIRKVLAALVGLVAGSVVNMGLVMAGGRLVPLPAGVDASSMEGLQAALPLFGPEHFVFPFLAHALGTLAGAGVATWLTPGRTAGPAWCVGGLFFIGGAINAFLLPGPAWFAAVDLVFAYAPMAWLGHRLAARGAKGA